MEELAFHCPAEDTSWQNHLCVFLFFLLESANMFFRTPFPLCMVFLLAEQFFVESVLLGADKKYVLHLHNQTEEFLLGFRLGTINSLLGFVRERVAQCGLGLLAWYAVAKPENRKNEKHMQE